MINRFMFDDELHINDMLLVINNHPEVLKSLVGIKTGSVEQYL